MAWRESMMHKGIVAAVVLLSVVAGSPNSKADVSTRQPTHIAAQQLAPALQTLARDRNVQLVYRSELAADHQTGGAKGNLTIEEALTQLLDGTGLTYRYLSEEAITLIRIPASS